MSRVPGLYANPGLHSEYIPGTHEPGFVEPPIRQLQLTPEMRKAVHGNANLAIDIWRMGDCHIIRAHEPEGIHGEMRYHLSISCEDRHPTWDEIKTARYRLLPPELPFAIILPPPQFYVNVRAQDHVFHLHEIEDDARPWEAFPDAWEAAEEKVPDAPPEVTL